MTAPPNAPPSPQPAATWRRLLPLAAWGAAVVTFAAWALVLVAHLDDAFGNDKVSGGWLVLGEEAAGGRLYPPLAEDGHYGGTRWMPLPVLAYALAHRLGGDSYWAAKAVVCLVGLALLAVLFLCVRAVGAPRDVAAALTAFVVVVPVGFDAVTTIAGDALSTVLQLVAVLLVHRHRERLTTRTVVIVGVLCALAFLAKLSALWAAAAVVVVLALRSRRLALVFTATAVSAVALGAGLTELASDGRFSENLVPLALAGGGGPLVGLVGARRLVSLLRRFAGIVVLLAPVAAFAGARRLLRRDVGVFDLGAVVAACLAVVVLSDVGAYTNHLLDVVVLLPVLAGSACALAGRLWPGALRVVAVAGLAVGLASHLGPLAREAGDDLRGGNRTLYGAEQLRGEVPEHATLLAQDPGVPYALGRRPVVNDAFMLPRIARSRPDAVEELRARIDRQEFDVVVLNNPVTHPPFYAGGDFGADIATTLCRRYRLDREVGGYLLYVPGAGTAGCPAA